MLEPVLSACVPLWTATLAYGISRKTLLAMVSGLLSVFALYYTPFMTIPDNYAIFMLLGATFLLLAPRSQKWIPLAHGALAGWMTLARSDGLLWLGLARLTVMWKASYKEDRTKNSFKDWFLLISCGLIGCAGISPCNGTLASEEHESLWLVHGSWRWSPALARKL